MTMPWYRLPPKKVVFPTGELHSAVSTPIHNPEIMMRKLLGLWLLLVFVLAACARDRSLPTEAGPAVDRGLVASADGDYVAGRLLVRFRPGAPTAAVLGPQQASIRREVLLGIKMLDVPVGAERAIAAALQNSPWVEFAEPDYLRTFGLPCESGDGDCSVPNDIFTGYKWDLHNDGTITNSLGTDLATTGQVDADMDWLEAFDVLGAFTGSARIGILDTGIRAAHEDLSGKVVAQYDFFADDNNAADDDGHGTHVAGIAAAHGNNGLGVAGVAWGTNVKLVIAKVCGPFGGFGYGCPSSAIADGIRWAVDNGANAINLSLGGPVGSITEQSALQYARSHDVLPFCAAGNESGPVSYPAAFPECVAVSATDWGDNLASYSNTGPQVELAAPGGDTENPNGYSYILSAYRSSNTSYVFMAGTSMATPQATGLAGLLHALGTTDDDAKLDRMKATADDLGASGVDNQFGSGRINVFAAITGAEPPPPPPPSVIVLLATTRVQGAKTFADLTWTGATGAMVDVYRNGSLRVTTSNDGAYSENLGRRPRGTITFKVCEAGTTTCSNEASVSF